MEENTKFSIDKAIQIHDKKIANLKCQQEDKRKQEENNEQSLENFTNTTIKPVLYEFKEYLKEKTKRGEILEGKQGRGSIELHMFLTDNHDDQNHPAIRFSHMSLIGEIEIQASLWASLDDIDGSLFSASEKISDVTKFKVEKNLEYLIEKSLE